MRRLNFIMKNHLILVTIIIIAVIFRIYISTFPSFESDQSAFRFWSLKLAEKGLKNFYFQDFFTSNPVGYFYILWLDGLFIKNFAPWIASNNLSFDLLLKLSANLTDILTGLFIYYLLSKKWKGRAGLLGFFLYVFNPVIFFNSSVWGQYDSIPVLFLLLATYMLTIKKFPEAALAFFAISLTLKPQIISLAPVIGIFLLLNYKFQRWIFSIFTFFIILVLIYLPFFPTNPFYGIYYVNQGSAYLFNCTTCFAFNFWGIFGNWQNDLNTFLGLPLWVWGVNSYILLLSIILFTKPFKIKYQIPFLYISVAVVILIFFSSLTRIHERYLFPFFVFFLLGAIMLKSRLLIILYLIVSLLHFLNLYLAYTYYQNINKSNEQVVFFMDRFSLFSVFFSLAVIGILLVYFLIINKKIGEND